MYGYFNLDFLFQLFAIRLVTMILPYYTLQLKYHFLFTLQ